MIPYQAKAVKLAGSSEDEVYKRAKLVFLRLEKRTKRRPYVRSAYFKKQKVFLDFFWKHIFQKGPKQRRDRLKYVEPAIELIEHSRNKPLVKLNPNKRSETLYRFAGLTRDKELFFVHLKEDTKKKKIYFMSVFSTDV